MAGLQADQTIEHITAILKRHLTSERGKKKPHGLEKALQEARSNHPVSPRDHTQQVFLELGLQAWVAFFLATHGHGRHYLGQKEELRTIGAFDLLSRGQRIEVATQIASIEAHESVTALIEALSMPTSKRRRLSENDNTENLLSFTIHDNTTSHRAEEQHEVIPHSAANLDGTNAIPTSSISIPNETSYARGPSEPTEPQQTISSPVIERIATIFPEYMCGAIRRVRDDRAAITMSFPYLYSPVACLMSLNIRENKVAHIACLMSLNIRENKIAHIARELFGVHIEIEDGLRCIVLGHGVRCVPGEEISLQGADTGAIDKLLGPDISSAIAKSPTRKEEVRQAIFATRCVTMQIARNPNEGAILNLNLELEGGFKAKEKLFK